MEKNSSWDTNRLSVIQKFRHFIWNAVNNHSFCGWPPVIPILRQIYLFYVHSPLQLNNILLSTLGTSRFLFPLRFPTRTPHSSLFYSICATCSARHILPDFINPINCGEAYRWLISSLCSFLHSPVNSSLLGTNILLITLTSINLIFRSSINESDQVSHLHK